MTVIPDISTDVLIIGAGPAGLTAAATLAPHLPGGVTVVEREAAAGGTPRHSDHPGYGIRDLKRFLSGPAYARRLTTAATNAGAAIHTQTMVTGWTGERTVEITSPAGRRRIQARAIILATGARERARHARLIPGDRPTGVYTTGQLQNLVHLHHQPAGTRAVIVGAELVSWSAAMTLREARCATVLMTTVHPTPEAYAAFTIPGRLALKIPVHSRTRVTRILGARPRQRRRDRAPRHPRPAHHLLRHRHLHGGLDPRQRTRARCRATHRPWQPRSAHRHPPSDDCARSVRDRQPRAPRRYRRRRRARRPVRRPPRPRPPPPPTQRRQRSTHHPRHQPQMDQPRHPGPDHHATPKTAAVLAAAPHHDPHRHHYPKPTTRRPAAPPLASLARPRLPHPRVDARPCSQRRRHHHHRHPMTSDTTLASDAPVPPRASGAPTAPSQDFALRYWTRTSDPLLEEVGICGWMRVGSRFVLLNWGFAAI